MRLHDQLLDGVQTHVVAVLHAGHAAEFLGSLTALRTNCRDLWAALPGWLPQPQVVSLSPDSHPRSVLMVC